MLLRLPILATAVLSVLGCAVSIAQPPKPQPENPVQLELTAEVATTAQDGTSSSLRITLRNTGAVAADLPMPTLACGNEDGSIEVRMQWHSTDPNDLSGYGFGCGSGTSDRPPLFTRVRNQWIHLRPGEFLIFTQTLRPIIRDWKPGSIEYWVEYTPPNLSPANLLQLGQAGYLPPTQPLRTEPHTFQWSPPPA